MRSLSLTIFALLCPVLAGASQLSQETKACLFASPIAFGASVTQATSYMIPAYSTVVRAVELYGGRYGTAAPQTTLPHSVRPYGLSPIRYVVKSLVGKASLNKISYIGYYMTSKEEHLGSSQISDMLSGKHELLYRKSKLIVGVDAFYWDAVWNTCRYNAPKESMELLIKSAKHEGKTLVLGNVPIENPDLVRIDSDRTTVQGLWYPPKPSCALSINKTLNEICTPENNCYLVDIKGDVDRLAAGEKLSVFGNGSYGYYDFRPDGVHLSDLGSRLVAEKILKALEEHPPKCEITPEAKSPAEDIAAGAYDSSAGMP